MPSSPPAHCARSVIFCEAVAIYGIIIAIVLLTKVPSGEAPFKSMDNADQQKVRPLLTQALFAGYAIFGAGLTTGLSNLACGCVPLSLQHLRRHHRRRPRTR